MKRIAFDIDDTLMKICRACPTFHQVPDHDLIQVLYWFVQNGDEVYVWSGGGVDYARGVVEKLGIGHFVKVIQKENTGNMDIAFDDQETSLSRVDVRVKRQERNIE